MIECDVESIVEAIVALGAPVAESRDALTLVSDRLHLARGPNGRVELFIEGPRDSFAASAVGKALDFGTFREVRDGREFAALVVHCRDKAEALRPMAHLAYEAWRSLRSDPTLSNEGLMCRLEPYISLVTERRMLSIEQQLGLAGELTFLTEALNRAEAVGVRPGQALGAWVGWDSASRDFKGRGIAVEVKTAGTAERAHWVHPMYQLLAAPGEAERVYVFSMGLQVDRSRSYRLSTIVDRILERLDGSDRENFLGLASQYGGIGYNLSTRSQYELEPGFLVAATPRLIRVEHLADVLRPESFAGGAPPERVRDLRYRVSLEGLPDVGSRERLEVLDAMLSR